jgi:rubrerythrin
MGTPIKHFLLRLALEEAIRREEQAYSFYQNAHESVTEPGAARVLLALSAEELRHRLKLEELQRRKDPHVRLELSPREQTVLFGSGEPAAFSSGAALTPEAVWRMALSKEQEAYTFYALLSEKSALTVFRDAFRFLSAEELRHVEWVRARVGP